MRCPVPIRSVHLLLALAAAVAAAPARGALQTQGGIGFVAITGATPGEVLVLDDAHHTEIGRGTVDRLGSFLFRDLASGSGYVVHDSAAGGFVSDPITVRKFTDVPDQSFYSGQTLTAGFQYIQARDGTLLAAMVRLPNGPGPFPTVVEYSGYPAADPDSPQASTLIAGVLGFATVGVNMRGSGCSGGVLDLFNYPTTADGYDIIEAVAAQSWVKGGKVGMVGISFPGISQLFVGGARPPHLAAIAPLSVIADIYRAPGFPGGIFNSGFAQTWLEERNSDAQPAPDGGQAYAIKRVNDGDGTCLANQRLRLQTQDAVQFTQSHPYYVPSLMDQRSPINWVGKIKVPTFLCSAFQDEQTGGDFASMLSRLPRRRDVKITVANGVHTTSLDPVNLWNWLAFLDIYVAGVVPNQAPLTVIAPVVYSMILGNGAPTPPLPSNRFAGVTSLKDAKKMFESDPHVRVLMENGAGSSTPGLPAATFELALRQWPAPQVRPTAWYFGPGGTLTPKRPTDAGGVDGFHPDPAARPQQTLPGQGQEQSWAVIPDYDWRALVDGTAVAYATPPLEQDVVIAGPSSVELWLRSSASDTDLQVTLTEVRQDGKETYVQNGWLRASHRKLDPKRSTLLAPRPTHLEADAAPLPAGAFTKIRLGLFSVAHVFRAGSRIRVSVEAPGGDRTRWDFDTPATAGAVLDEVSRTPAQPSRLLLPVLPGVSAPPALPPCPGLRGQPCRTYAPATNGG